MIVTKIIISIYKKYKDEMNFNQFAGIKYIVSNEGSIKLIDDDYYSEQFDVFVNLSSDPNTSVFKFSCAGQDERNPCGYAHVNMDLFQPKECK